MAKEPGSYPLLIELAQYSRLPRYWVTLMIAFIMLLVLVLAAFLGGVFTQLSEWSFWRNFLDAPVLIIYILVVYPLIWRLWWQSAQALQLLTPIDERDLNRSEIKVPIPNRRWEWVAILMGAVFWLSLWQPWGWSDRWKLGAIWLSAYEVITQSILFGLISLLIYSSSIDNWYINRLIRQRVDPDIFNTGMLTPIARSSLGFSVAWIGGISLSLVFQTQEDLLMWKNIIVWVILVCFAVLIFFLSMLTTHSTIAKVKRHELDLVQKYLKTAYYELKERAEDGSLKGTEEVSSTITAWLNYERRIKEVPEWPYTASIIRRLVASTVVPAVVYLLKIISGLGLGF
jgi:hypothetical protein